MRDRRRPERWVSAGACCHAPRLLADRLRGEPGLELGFATQVLALASRAGGGVLRPPGHPGATLGVDGGQEQPTEHREVLEEVQPLLVLRLGVALVPELVT